LQFYIVLYSICTYTCTYKTVILEHDDTRHKEAGGKKEADGRAEEEVRKEVME
jgi:hypothetical protein